MLRKKKNFERKVKILNYEGKKQYFERKVKIKKKSLNSEK